MDSLVVLWLSGAQLDLWLVYISNNNECNHWLDCRNLVLHTIVIVFTEILLSIVP